MITVFFCVLAFAVGVYSEYKFKVSSFLTGE